MALYRINQLALPLDADESEIPSRVAKLLRLESAALIRSKIERKSVDARDKADLRIVYGLLVETDGIIPRSVPASVATPAPPPVPYEIPVAGRPFPLRPVVVGAGPAGIFAALTLAEAGARPIVLERGDPADARHRAIVAFDAGGDLDPESNIQFGEGGAGTYSDGKLTTQVRDERGRNRKVIRELVDAGAPEEIEWLAKPHVGTDRLRSVVVGLRRRIMALGGEFRFRARMDGIEVAAGAVHAVFAGPERIETDALILAPGHSARDVFALLESLGVEMERKPFAIGLRIEHPQEQISRSQYGPRWNHPRLGAADYKLAAKTTDGRGVYSFCMCPGGTVVNSSSETGGLVCNGMSDFARNGVNSNAAIVVAVGPEDFGGEGLLAGVEFQRRWERLAFAAGGGGYSLPVQLFGDFRAGVRTTVFGAVRPSATRGHEFAELGACLPSFASRGIAEGIARFGRSIEGFDREDALLTGVETRTSSPLRVLRDGNGEASLRGLFPAGEGAGYAGGIMSAAMDGIRAAERVLSGQLTN